MIYLIIIIGFFVSMANAQLDIGKLIVEYEEECYNDSSFENVHIGGKNLADYCRVDWECLVSSHWKEIWLHREPTWNGFRKFVKEEYKKLNIKDKNLK